MVNKMASWQTLVNYLGESMDSHAILLGLVVFLILAWLAQSYLYQVKDLPPGPIAWPLVGCIPQLLYMTITTKPRTVLGVLLSLYQVYGPVCCLTLPFGKRVVIMSGYKAVHESVLSPELNQRPPMPHQSEEVLNGDGIIMSSGDTWKEHRRFSLNVLRGLGVGKRSFEDQIAAESECLIKEIHSNKEKPFDASHLFSNAVSNVICSVVFGKRFEYNDQEFKQLLFLLEDSTSHLWFTLLFVTVPNLLPLLVKIPCFPKDSWNSMVTLRQKLKDIVDEHRDTLDTDNMRDYIDVYLNEFCMKKDRGEQTYLSEIELLAVVHDFFLAGTETTSSTLLWALLYMVTFPDVQKRVHEEIDAVVGQDRLPRLADKPNLPYTQAVIHEIQRFASIVTFSGVRYVNRMTKFEGFTLPKDTYVMSNLFSATRDPSVWENSNDFKPKRFLDDNGQVVKIPEQIVFGEGKRACLGEQLARMELFIFFTHLMHQFSFKKPTTTDKLNLERQGGVVATPHPYNVCAICRT